MLAGRYRVDRALGHGAFGQVWSGRDLILDRDIAVKLMLDEDGDQDLLKWFEREAKVAARLRHPRLLTVYDAGLHAHQLFIVMELLEGTDLARVMAHNRTGLPAARAVDLGIMLTEGLAAVHAKGVVHRDLKPANLFVEPGDQLKICDFGIARDNNASTQRGHANSVGGTPLYAPPEWWLGTPVAAEASADMYAAGGILYEMLTGRAPFADAPSLAALMRDHLGAAPVPPRHINTAVPPALNDLVLRLLAKEPRDRPTAAEAHTALTALRSALVRGGPQPGDFGQGAGQASRGGPGGSGGARPVGTAPGGPAGYVPTASAREQSGSTVSFEQHRTFGPGGRAQPPDPAPSSPPWTEGPVTRPGIRRQPRFTTRAKIGIGVLAGVAVAAAATVAALLVPGQGYATLGLVGGTSPDVVAISQNGAMAAEGYAVGLDSLIGNIYLWNTATNKQVGELPGMHGDAYSVEALAFSPDGTMLAVGSDKFLGGGGVACVWLLASHTCTKLPGPAAGNIDSMAFSPDGKLLAVGEGGTDTTYVWNVKMAKVVQTVAGGSAVAFSPSGQLLVTGDSAGTVRVASVATGHVEAQIAAPSDIAIDTVAVSPDDRYAAAGMQDGSVDYGSLSDPNSWQIVHPPVASDDGSLTVGFSANGKSLFAAEGNNTAFDLAIPGFTVERSVSIPGSEMLSAAFDAGSATMLLASNNNSTVALWRPQPSHS